MSEVPPAGQSPLDPEGGGHRRPKPDHDAERLAAFLFRMARDEVSFGDIESHVRVVETAHANPDQAIQFIDSARHMGEWARDTAARILGRV